MTAPRVFVIQNPHILDRKTSVLTPKYDFTDAKRFGTVIQLLSPSANPFTSPVSIIDELHSKLRDFDSRDFLLCVGSPVLIGWAFAVASSYTDATVTALQWSGRDQAYKPIKSMLFAPEDNSQ